MTDHRDPHTGLHSQQGALPDEHRGRAANPIVKVHDLAWLEFEKPDLERAERFAHAFGFATAARTPDELHSARERRRHPVRADPQGSAVTLHRSGVPGGRLD